MCDGVVLVVVNYVGVLLFDGLMLLVVVYDEYLVYWDLWLFVVDMVFDFFVIGEVVCKVGYIMVCMMDVYWLFVFGEFIVVFFEGYKGLGKCFEDCYWL